MSEHIVGYVGCFFLSVFLVPQVYTTCKTRDVAGLSPTFLGTSMIANVLMIYYGLQIRAYPVTVANGSVLLNSSTLMALYFRYRRTSNKEAVEIEIETKADDIEL